MKTAAPLALACLLSTTLAATAESVDYRIDNAQFATSEGPIPPACIGRMMTELNGDNFIAAIYLNRNSMRGCIDSNYAGDSSIKERYTYKIQSETAPHTYNLVVCEKVEGSLGESCEKIILELTNVTYLLGSETKRVLSMKKLGEWTDRKE
ncbi:hypothetical protein [Spongiibacter marinus]|uniref:hypothetical protein n=1 Tax=Spongiibacter marinus TaxID=354246 RepID=UPI000684EC6C|nr:hypothetical protein [Spongiibacter marinus]